MVYHANPPGAGGFLGVEVFFVISGYLITLLLIGEHERRARSACAFWLRRARRLLPALFAAGRGRSYTAFSCVTLGQLRGDVVAGSRTAELVSDLGRPGVHRGRRSPRCATCGGWPSRSSSTWCGRW